jgi:hypothetical protein
MEYYSVMKKNELIAGKWMELEIIMLSEISQMINALNHLGNLT